MTTDLLAQLRAYGRHLESEMTPLEVDEAATPLVRKSEAPIRSRRWVVALVPAAILVILVPILLIRDSPPAVITGPDISLSRGSVAFSGPGVGDADIFVTREGVGAQRIVGSDRDGFDQTCPRFSPDGTKLAYVETNRGGISPGSIGGGPSEVVVVDFDGGAGAPELFRAPSTWRGCPTWSPDSTRVAYVVENPVFISEIGDQWLLQVATLDGEMTSLFDDFSSHFAVEWSPDGTNIAVRGMDVDDPRPDSNRVWIVPVDGGLARLVADVAGCEAQPLAWSPDGSKIVIGDGEELDGSIRIVDIDGSGEVSIPAIGLSGPCDDVAWSPNGAWLAYTDGADGRIVLVSPDGDDRVKLPAGPLPGAETPYYIWADPVWSSDSTSLLMFVTKTSEAAIVALAVDPDTPSVTFQYWDDWVYEVDYMGGLTWQAQGT